MLEYLKLKWSFLGIDAPAFAWIVAGSLIIFTVINLIRLAWELRRQSRVFQKASKELEPFRKPADSTGPIRLGLTLSEYQQIDAAFNGDAVSGLRAAWNDFSSHFLIRGASGGEDRYWSTRNAEDSFSQRKLVTERLNRDYYHSLSGIITGIGLLTTFLAILVALLDVRLVENRVQGLELLIQGLSGKFITSVVALLCATVFIFFEKNRFHHLEKGQLRLASLIDQIVPQLSPVHILSNIHADTRSGLLAITESTSRLQEHVENQTVCIQDFNTSLAPMLQQTFDESMTPTLNRMIKSIEEMNEFLRAAEANRSDTITDSIKELLTNLQTSLTGSISEMGGKFNDSLSGNAQQQFAAVAESLANTTGILDSMNAQFSSSQNSMQEMIELARSTTKEQITLNQNQLNSLGETIGSLMIDLSERVNDLGEKMGEVVQANSEQAVGAAGKVIERAQEWSVESASKLTQLMEAHQSQFDRVVKTRELLDDTIVKFNQSLEGLLKISVNSQTSVQQINSAVNSISSAADRTAETQQNLLNISALTADQLKELGNAHQRQEEVWEAIAANMNQYKATFGTVENSAGALLEQIGTNLENYQQVCEKGFNKLIEVSDGHFTNATEKLGASVSELDEVMQDLSESLARLEGDLKNGRG